MTLEISDQFTIHDLQKAFSEQFPFLKIEFFSKAHSNDEASPVKKQYRHDKKIGEIRKIHNPGAIEISGSMGTGELEQTFRNRFGLNVQVYRNMKGSWIQTIGTDHFTLDAQNDIGQKAQVIIHPDYNERIDNIEPW